MQTLIKSLLLAIALVSCGTDTDSRYRDLSQLERPPILPADPTYRPDSSYTVDSSRIERQSTNTGLGDRVYLNTTPLQIRIKQPIEKAWYALAQALKQSDFKITDYDREKRVYYISSGKASDGFFSFLSSDKVTHYVLSMKGSGNETAVMANLAQTTEQSNQDDNDNTAEQVLRLLYGILHDDLNLEYNGS